MWLVNGQKVWTSGGQLADLGMLLARTNPAAPKHQGITWFAFDMHQPGRRGPAAAGDDRRRDVQRGVPHRRAWCRDAARIGDVNNGWASPTRRCSTSVRAWAPGGERPQAPAVARAGTVAGDLDQARRRLRAAPPDAAGGRAAPDASRAVAGAGSYIDLARELGRTTDPVVRQGSCSRTSSASCSRLNTERHKAVRAAGGDIPGIANFSKLLMADILRHNRDLGMQILGARGMLHAYDAPSSARPSTGRPAGAGALASPRRRSRAQALPIYGGTDQIQRNIIGERVARAAEGAGRPVRGPVQRAPEERLTRPPALGTVAQRLVALRYWRFASGTNTTRMIATQISV